MLNCLKLNPFPETFDKFNNLPKEIQQNIVDACTVVNDDPLGQHLFDSLRDSYESGTVDPSLGLMDSAPSGDSDSIDCEDVDPRLDWNLDKLQRQEALKDHNVKGLMNDVATKTPAPSVGQPSAGQPSE